MTDITTGGLRDRLIRDAISKMIKDSLTALGWFEAGRAHRPILWREAPLPVNPDEEIPLNTLTVSMADVPIKFDGELGSTFGEQRHPGYVDLYAESEAVGTHLMGDVRDILRGEFPSIDRDAPVLFVYDLTQTPVPAEPAFYLEITDVEEDRMPRETSRVWEQFWFMCRFELCDER